MPDLSQTQPATFPLEGGLVLDKPQFAMQAGEALELQNFEPDIDGGYRRINGFTKYNANIVPQTSSSSEEILMTTFFNGDIIVARGEKIFRGTNGSNALNGSINTSVTTITVDSTTNFSTAGTLLIGSEQITYTGKSTTQFTGCGRGANSTSAAEHSDDATVTQYWTEIDSGRSGAGVYTFAHFTNAGGAKRLMVVDGDNDPWLCTDDWDSDPTSIAHNDITDNTNAVQGSKFVVHFKGHMIYAGRSAAPAEVYIGEKDDHDDLTNNILVHNLDSPVVGLKVFRETLFVFCENRIWKITGSATSGTDIFVKQPVTQNIGCVNGQTIQEFAGDLIFLAPDGLRTVAGTARIGDVELGTVSGPVKSFINAHIASADKFRSLVIPDKTQYRLFFTKSGTSETSTHGLIAVIKNNKFEFSQIYGIKPTSTDTLVDTSGTTVVHGGADGYVYQQESGSSFDGTAIEGKYRSPDLNFGDSGVRKHMQRVLLNYKPEASLSADLYLRYDYESPDTPTPLAYSISDVNVAAVYGEAVYNDVATYGGQKEPLKRISVEGSGFTVAVRVNDNGVGAPYALRGVGLEYQVGARR